MKTIVSFIVIAVISSCSQIAYAGTVTYKYDALGRVIEVNYSNGSKIIYTYDAAGNRIKVRRTAGS